MGYTVYDLDPTDANNTSVSGISQAENVMTPSNVNNAFRALDGNIARFVDDLGGVNTVGGTADAITVTLASGITAYATGQRFVFKAASANTGAATINVNSLGVKKIRLKGDTALGANAMLANGRYELIYDAAYDSAAGAFVLMNPEGATSSFSTDVSITSTDAGAGAAPAMTLYRNSATPAASDLLGNVKFDGEDSAGNTETYADIVARIDDTTSTSEDGSLLLRAVLAGSLTTHMIVGASAVSPGSSDGAALGTPALMWSDLFLASGAVVNFNNGDVTITHSANALAFAGATGGYTFDDDLLLPSAGVINFNSGDITLTHSANVLTFTGGAFTVDSGGSVDFSAATEFKVPVSAAPTVNANGEIALDTTVADWSHGIFRAYAGEEVGIIVMPIAEFAGMSNGDVPTYNATNDEFEMAPASSGPTLDTEQATTSGTEKDFTIPAGAKRIMVMLNGVSPTAADDLGIQLGDAGGIESTGYDTVVGAITGTNTTTTSITTDRFRIKSATGGSEVFSGIITLCRMNDSHTWAVSGNVSETNGGDIFMVAGAKTLSAELTTVRLISGGAFDAGSVNVMYE